MGVDTACAVVMSAAGRRGFMRACKADVVLETSSPQIPMDLGSPQCALLFASSLEPQLQLRADSRSLKCQRAGLVPWGWPSLPLQPTAAGTHHVGSLLPFPFHPLCSLQPPRASPPCPGPGSHLDNLTYHGRCLPFIPHCLPSPHGPFWSLRVTLTPGFDSGNEGHNPCLPVPL